MESSRQWTTTATKHSVSAKSLCQKVAEFQEDVEQAQYLIPTYE